MCSGEEAISRITVSNHNAINKTTTHGITVPDDKDHDLTS
jgi:hypothetical protein